MKHYKDKFAIALLNYFRNYRVLEQMIDREHDTFEDIRIKKLIGSTFRKYPSDRTQTELVRMGQYFSRYKFFSELKGNQDEMTYQGVMRFLKFLTIEPGKTIIEEGDTGDRFYVVIRGTVSIMKAYTMDIP